MLPLTEWILHHCTDERTTDFTLALMDFIEWDDLNSKAYNDELSSPSSVKGSDVGLEGRSRDKEGLENDGVKGGKGSPGHGLLGGRTTSSAVLISSDIDSGIRHGKIIDNSSSSSSSDCTNANKGNESIADDINKYYVWPDFILDLLTHTVEWASWRKRVERAMFNKDTAVQANVKKRRLNDDKSLDIVDLNNIGDDIDKELKVEEEVGRKAMLAAKRVQATPMTRRKAYFEALCQDRLKELQI